jgi:hypothetical protein
MIKQSPQFSVSLSDRLNDFTAAIPAAFAREAGAPEPPMEIPPMTKNNMRNVTAALMAAATLILAATTGPAAAAEAVGSNQMCIMSNYIEETPVIDSRTILVRMNPGRGYKRIELATDCNTIADGKSLAFDTSVNRLCVQDTLNAHEDSGHACTISKIVTIDADEAQELLSRRR